MKDSPTSARELTNKQKAELSVLEALPDEQIDTSDIPEISDWSNARRGLFYRPVKQQITSSRQLCLALPPGPSRC